MEIDKTDWCLQGVLKAHKIIRKFATTSKTSSYLAKDEKDNRFALTYIEQGKILERYRLAAHKMGEGPAWGEAFAQKKLSEFCEQLKEITERTKGLSHPHVAEAYDFGIDNEKDQMVIISEYVPGLDMFLGTRGFAPMQMISLFVQLLDGLEFIHKNRMLHLNLKASKVRIDLEGLPPIVKITDFGFAIPTQGFTGEYYGTPFYMAPEVIFEKREKIDYRADLYSFAVLAYCCLTGRYPFEGRQNAGMDRDALKRIVEKEGPPPPPSQYAREIPAELDEILLKLIRPEPDERDFKNASEVIFTFDKAWPNESREMPHETVTTLTED